MDTCTGSILNNNKESAWILVFPHCLWISLLTFSVLKVKALPCPPLPPQSYITSDAMSLSERKRRGRAGPPPCPQNALLNLERVMAMFSGKPQDKRQQQRTLSTPSARLRRVPLCIPCDWWRVQLGDAGSLSPPLVNKREQNTQFN